MIPFAAYTKAETPKCFSVGLTTPELAPFCGGISPPAKMWLFGPSRVSPPNGILISSAGFAGLTHVPNRQTDHATYVRATES